MEMCVLSIIAYVKQKLSFSFNREQQQKNHITWSHSYRGWFLLPIKSLPVYFCIRLTKRALHMIYDDIIQFCVEYFFGKNMASSLSAQFLHSNQFHSLCALKMEFQSIPMNNANDMTIFVASLLESFLKVFKFGIETWKAKRQPKQWNRNRRSGSAVKRRAEIDYFFCQCQMSYLKKLKQNLESE